MCVIYMYYHMHERCPLVVAANRDEFYSRPTRRLGIWDTPAGMIAGQDRKNKGTWMGVGQGGRFSALTNYRDPFSVKPDAPSRGNLVRDFLEGEQSPGKYLEEVDKQYKSYNGFNLIAGDRETLLYYSNRTRQIQNLVPGFYGLSNHLLDTPWPKVEKGKALLTSVFTSTIIDPEAVFAVLHDQVQAEDHCLPDTGVGKDWERILSPIFVKSPVYGTRSSAVLFVGKNGGLDYYERTWKPSGEAEATVYVKCQQMNPDIAGVKY